MNLNTSNLSPMQLGRVNAALDKRYQFSDGVRSLREHFAKAETIEKSETDGMIDWSRTKFNRMDHKEQREYETRLKEKRYYWINNIKVAKIVYDAFS